MAVLANDAGTLRFALGLADRAPGDAPGGDALVAAAALEYLDRRDGGWWPIVRLSPIRLAAAAVEGLRADLAGFLRGGAEGFSWRPADEPPVGLQVGAGPGGLVAELGLDLGRFLAEAGGAPHRPGAELALFRFAVTQASLVVFCEGLDRELEALRRAPPT